MTNQVVNYKNFDPEQLFINAPVEKQKGKYVSYISYSDNISPLYIQTPTMKLESNGNDFFTFSSDVFSKLLSDLDEKCVNVISVNSKQFFNDKVFSREKIEQSYVSSTFNENEFTVSLADDLKVKDQRERFRLLSDLEANQEVVAILHVKGLLYKKSSIQLFCSVEQLKVYVKDSLSCWCIEESGDESEDVDSEIVQEQQPEPVEQEAQLEVSEPQLETIIPTMEILCVPDDTKETASDTKKTRVKRKYKKASNDDDKDLF